MKKTIEFGPSRLRVKAGVIAVHREGKDLKDLLRQFTNKGDGRGNVVMARVNDDALAHMDQLVEADLFGSRSECAAFLIGAGIASQKQLFERLAAHTAEMRKLKEQLRQVAMDALKPAGQLPNEPDASR